MKYYVKRNYSGFEPTPNDCGVIRDVQIRSYDFQRYNVRDKVVSEYVIKVSCQVYNRFMDKWITTSSINLIQGMSLEEMNGIASVTESYMATLEEMDEEAGIEYVKNINAPTGTDERYTHKINHAKEVTVSSIYNNITSYIQKFHDEHVTNVLDRINDDN